MVTETSSSTAYYAPVWPLFQFFLLAFALMWVCFFTVALVPIPTSAILGQFLVLLGAFAPSLAALLVTARTEGRRGVVTLLSGVIKWRVAARWYLFAATYTVIVKLSVAVLHRVAVGVWPLFDAEPRYIIPLAVLFSTTYQYALVRYYEGPFRFADKIRSLSSLSECRKPMDHSAT